MNVFLTFDIEVWCDGWNDLDEKFPGAFARYVYGRSKYGDYALPQTLAILNQHGLKGVFFVEPLFATRFGTQHLEIIVKMIREAGQEVQLHLHPEWSDEALKPIIENCATKRQHLSYYTLDEQTTLIGHGKRMLEAAGSGPIKAFRAGSYAANRDTFEALRHNHIYLDTSLNHCFDISAPDLRGTYSFDSAFETQGVSAYPVTVMLDGFKKNRPIQIGACSFSEMRDALWSAHRLGSNSFVFVSHNFEMLKIDRSEPDWIVVKRFERLCEFLAEHPDIFKVRGFDNDLKLHQGEQLVAVVPKANLFSTARRYFEQVQRRLI